MRMLKYISGMSLIFALVASNAATATNTTSHSDFAVVDMHHILEKSPQMTKIRNTLEGKFSKEHASLTTEQDSLKKRAEKLESEKSVMTKKELETKRASLSKDQEALQKKQMQFQQKVFAAQDEAMKTLMEKITTIVTSIANKNHYSLVVPKNSTIYVSSGHDITTEVEKTLK